MSYMLLLEDLKDKTYGRYTVEGNALEYYDYLGGDTADWVFIISDDDTSRRLTLKGNSRSVAVEIRAHELHANIAVNFNSGVAWHVMDEVMYGIAGVLTSNADMVAGGSQDDLNHELMPRIYNDIRITLAEYETTLAVHGVTDCSYTGTLFNRTQVKA